MYKKWLILSFLEIFFNSALNAVKGQTLAGGHVTLLETGKGKTVTQIDVMNGYSYKVTVEKIKQ